MDDFAEADLGVLDFSLLSLALAGASTATGAVSARCGGRRRCRTGYGAVRAR